MKHILVPCDFSDEAKEAYKFAIDLAILANLNVKVIYTIDLPVLVAGLDVQPYAFDIGLQNELKESAIGSFNNMKEKYHNSSVVSFEVIFDSLVRAIRSQVEKGDVELVVMGTKGSSGMDEILFGSNTEKIVRFSSVPVLAIRTAPKISSIKKIVFPNRLGLDQTELVKRVVDLQKFFGADLYIVWVNTPASFLPDVQVNGLMKEFADHYKLDNYKLVVRNEVEERSGILGYAHQINADMIVMGTSSRRGLSHLLVGSIAEDVVNHVQCPIWTFSTRK